MFIENAFRAKHQFWRYVIGILIVFAATQIGTIPLVIALLLNNGLEGLSAGNLTTGLGNNIDLLLMLISFAVGLIGLYVSVKYIHQQKWKEILTTRPKFDWKRFFFSFIIWGVFVAVTTYIDYQSHPEMYEWNFKLMPFLGLLLIAVIFIPLQTGLEEFVFRGYLMQGIGVLTKNRWAPLLITSIIFGGLHYANPEVAKMGEVLLFYYIGTGLFLGVLTLMDDGLELSYGFHTANNLIGLLLLTSDWAVIQGASVLKKVEAPETVGTEILLPLLVFYPVLLIVFALRYKWKNWGKRLWGKIKTPAPPLKE